MKEYDLYSFCIPIIAEMVARCRRLSGGEYQDWKEETMGHCPETVRGFMGKVLTVIDKYVLESNVGYDFKMRQERLKENE